jgi:hypothetical protein
LKEQSPAPKGYGTATIEQEVNLLQILLGIKPKLAVDIGGNIGNYAAELRKKNPTLEIQYVRAVSHQHSQAQRAL